MNIDPRSLATLGELLNYGELGNIDGLSPELARYINENFEIDPEEKECEACKELRDTLDEIHGLTQGVL